MLYTVLPVRGRSGEGVDGEVREVFQGRRLLRIEVQDGGEGVIRSILSSNPSDYLDPALQPGTRVKLSDLERN